MVQNSEVLVRKTPNLIALIVKSKGLRKTFFITR